MRCDPRFLLESKLRLWPPCAAVESGYTPLNPQMPNYRGYTLNCDTTTCAIYLDSGATLFMSELPIMVLRGVWIGYIRHD